MVYKSIFYKKIIDHQIITCDSHSSMNYVLAGNVSLNLGLVDPIDAGPDKCSSNAYGPKSVSPQRVCVKASGPEKAGLRLDSSLQKKKKKIYTLLTLCREILSLHWTHPLL